MIAERIYRGETAAQIGISQCSYDSRVVTLKRFLKANNNRFDAQAYQAWVVSDGVGDRAPWTPDKTSRGLGDTVAKITSAVGIKPCGGCKKRQQKLNQVFPYRQKT